MIKKFLTLALAAACITGGNVFAGSSLLDGIAAPEIRSELAVPAASRVTEESRYQRDTTWTIMVYVNAKNNLEEYGLKDINEMEAFGSTEKVKVVAELGRMNGFSFAEGNWTGSRRYFIQKDNNPSAITSPVVENMPSADMGDWNHLVDFVKWAKTNYPSRNYMLIVWNHGSGWVKRTGDKGISYDDETGNHITTPQLGQALRAMKGVDIYASDACLMQMLSVAYEIKDRADYIVGSEETEPGDGYTYDLLLEKINASDLTALGVGKATVDAYSDHYKSIGQSSTHSLIKTEQLQTFVSSLNAFADTVMTHYSKNIAKAARAKTASYAYDDNKDLLDFVRNMLDLDPQDSSVPEEENLENAGYYVNHMAKKVVVYNRTNTFMTGWDNKDYSTSQGLAIYLPDSGYNPSYDTLQLGKVSSWPKFIKWLNGK